MGKKSKNMPKVGKKHFPYTAKGKSAAKRAMVAAKKKGMKMSIV